MNIPDESALVAALVAGDEAAWRRLYEAHYAVLCHIAAQYLHDDFMAQTAVGDVMLHLWQARGTWSVESSLRQYLVASVRHRCLDVLRSSYHLHETPTEADRLLDAALDATPQDTLLAKELERAVADAIARLPDATRRVFSMSRFDGLTYAEIAAKTGITTHTVKYHVRTALARLAEELGRYLVVAWMLYLV